MSNSPPHHAAGDPLPGSAAPARVPRPSWHASRDSDFLVQAYQEEGPLVECVSGFLSGALLDGAAALVFATPGHGAMVEEALGGAGVDVPRTRHEGRYVVLDAARTLDELTPGGSPDPGAFSRIVGAALGKLTAEWPRVAVYDEMLALLRRTSPDAAHELEALWDELLSGRPAVLLSGYAATGGDQDVAAGIARLCGSRCRVFLTERQASRLGAGDAKADRDRAWLAAIVAGSDDAIISKDLNGRITSWNRGAEQLFGYSAEEAVGRSVTMLIPEDRRGEEPVILRSITEGEPVETYETVRLRKDGTPIEISLTISPVRDAEGRIVGASKIARDIGRRREAERRLRDAEAYYRRLTDLLPIGVYTCDARGAVTYYNEHAARLWGRTPELGEPGFVWSDVDPDDPGALEATSPVALALSEGRSFRKEELVVERPDGSHATVLVDIDPIVDAEGRLLGSVVVLHDVTDVKRTERELREQREQLETLLETVPVAVLLAHDARAQRITGNRAAAEVLRVPATANFSLSPPPGEPPPPFHALRGTEPLAAEDMPLQRAARGETVTADEIDYVLEDGSVLHTIVSARPLFGSAGEPRGAVAAMMDITELKASAEALRDADRLKTEFLATLSHELRNPLAPILTGLEVMRVLRDDPETLERTRTTVERQSLQLVRLVDDLLDIARITRGRLELRKRRTSLADVIEQAVDAMTPAMQQHGHTFTVDAPPPDVEVEADAERLVQALGNLLHNAAIYTPAQGHVSLRVDVREEEATVVVQDTGVGIPLDMRERVFEMFAQVNRSHERGHSGLGVGLTLARSLVEAHGGALEVESQGLDLGSTFTVRLPRLAAAAPAAVAVATPPAVAEAPAPKRVLIVDDNEAFIESLGMLIETLGHEVRTAADGARALEVGAELHPDLVLMDLGMPGMNGYDAAKRMREELWGRNVTLVALTGWGRAEDKKRTREAGFDHHMVKPPQPAELRRLLAV
jgi:PAS domain S-box-containing protein